MKLLDRSRSLRGRGGRKNETHNTHDTQDTPRSDAAKEQPSNVRKNRKSVMPEEPKLPNARRSFHRPSTVDKPADCAADLQIPGQIIEIKAGDDTFNFPTPSPRLPPPRSATFQSSPSPLAGRDGELSPPIGIALGSPTQAPQWGPSFTSDQLSSRMPRQAPPARAPPAIPQRTETEPVQPQLKKQKSAWKTLGSLFQRKPSKSTAQEPFYKVHMPQPEQEQKPPKSVQLRPRLTAETRSPIVRSPGSISSHHSRTPSLSRGMARFEARATADRASFLPAVNDKMRRSPSAMQPRQSVVPTMKPLPNLRASEDMFKAMEDRRDSPMATPRIPGATPRTPRLDLDIPNSEMERYSVMFEKLLEQEQKPSLLERRQSKLKRLTSVKEKDGSSEPAMISEAHEPTKAPLQRSATSPHLTKMPSLSIRVSNKQKSPETPKKFEPEQPMTAIHRPRPLQRSKTAPVGSMSPVLAQFGKASSASPGSVASAIYSENSLPPTPTTFATSTGGIDSVAVVSHDPMPVRPRTDQSEPIWDMVTSKPFKLTVTTPDDDTDDMPNPYLRVKSPEDLERQIVQVSVARQVSVSKARRQVEKAVSSKQPLRPRVVELTRNRKSTVVLIEGGDD